ncbi:MAG: hypothetical protein CML13_09865 [Puniceicoccaceae bacterium]|nr:hypothetical protein [Puniceicoccaceae bacterium]
MEDGYSERRKSCRLTTISGKYSPHMKWPQRLTSPPKVKQLAWAVHGQQVKQETYRLPDYWSLHFYEYRGQIDCGDQSYKLQPGAVSIVPPGMPITFHYEGPSEHLYCHFSIPQIDSKEASSSACLQNDTRLPQLKNLLSNAIPLKHNAPQRVDLRLWDVLLGIQDIFEHADSYPRHDRIIETATQIVMQEMAQPLTIPSLARRCQISHNQLIRILKEHTRESPSIWLRRLRTDRARELLTYSDLPIKVIASEVGYPDLQHFNKVIRQQFGRSPRTIRKTKEAL